MAAALHRRRRLDDALVTEFRDVHVGTDPHTELHRIAVRISEHLGEAVDRAIAAEGTGDEELGVVLIVVRGLQAARDRAAAGEDEGPNPIHTGLVTNTGLEDMASILWNSLEAILGPESMAQWAAMQRGDEVPS